MTAASLPSLGSLSGSYRSDVAVDACPEPLALLVVCAFCDVTISSSSPLVGVTQQ